MQAVDALERETPAAQGTDDELRPVIIGAGLTGMAISRILSEAGIRHSLIGQRPSALPCLGESMNLEGTLGFQEGFPELARFFSPKKFAVAYLGDHAFSCRFAFHHPAFVAFFRSLGYKAPAELLHVDRLSFDATLFERVVASLHCVFFETQVSRLDYDPDADTITAVYLSEGPRLSPTYVFDAAGHARLLARMLGISCTMIGDVQRVAFTYYRVPEGAPSGPFDNAWYHATTGMRLYPDVDGVDGLAWCIPLHRHVSIGVGMRADDNTLSDDELLDIAERAYARRGIVYRQYYPEPMVARGFKHRYYIHERAYGANWLLAGGSYCQIWWMAGAGSGAGLTAAQIALKFMAAPQKTGRRFQKHMQMLINTHSAFEWLTAVDQRHLSKTFIARHTDQFIVTNLKRLTHATRFRKGWVAPVCGFLVSRLALFERAFRNFCDVRVVDVPEPAATTPAGVGSPG